MKNKKILVGLLSTSTIAMVAPTIASCANVTKPVDPVDPITPVQKEIFDIEGDTLKGFKSSASEQMIKDYCKDGVLRLPAVKTIGANAFNAELLKVAAPFGGDIIIKDTTTAIGEKAFYGYSAASVAWGTGAFETKKSIGAMAFAFCSNLTSIQLPKGLFMEGSSIGGSVFAGCTSLATLDLSNIVATDTIKTTGWTPGCFCGLASTGKVLFNNSITTDAHREKMGLEVWSTLVASGMKPQWNMCDQSGNEWAAQYKYVPMQYFNVESNVLKGATRAWDDDAPFNCAKIPGYVTSINFDKSTDNIFKTKTQVTSLWDLSSTGISAIPDSCFKDISTTSLKLKLPATVSTIGTSSFQDYKGTIEFAETKQVTSFGNYAFKGSNIASWKFSDAVTAMGTEAFGSTSNLLSLDFSEYDMNTELSSVWPADTFSGIATNGVITVKNLYPTDPTPAQKISQWQLQNTLKTYIVEKGVPTSGTTAWTFSPSTTLDYSEIFEYNADKTTILGWAKNAETTPTTLTAKELNAILVEKGVHTLTIPTGVTTIAANAFYDSGTSKSTIPTEIISIDLSSSGVTTIGNDAFKGLNGTKVTSVKLPTGIVTIGANAFEDLPLLVDGESKHDTIDFKNLTALTTIGNAAFKNNKFASTTEGTEITKPAVDFTGDTALQTISPNAFVTTYTECDSVKFPADTDWETSDGNSINVSDMKVNATSLKDGSSATGWGTLGVQKAATDEGRFNGKTWSQVAAACNAFESATATETSAKTLCTALGFELASTSTDPQTIIRENIVDSDENAGTVIINDMEHTVKCIDAMHDTTADGKTVALTFELFNVVTKIKRSHPIKPSSTWGVNGGDNYTYTSSVLYNNLVGTATWTDGTNVLPNAQTMLLTGTPSLKNKLKTVVKAVQEYNEIGDEWALKTYSAPIFALTWNEVNHEGSSQYAEGTPYHYWTQHTAADRVFTSAEGGYVETYWLSSPNVANNCAWSIIASGSSAGTPANTQIDGSGIAVVFAFCI